jgi:D-beta-D-heptose 7-phosphate kinase/D-beta-D-heptose 1-phosphate adenosyltransferase
VYVDPKGRDYEKYRGATAIKPNRQELAEIAEAMGWPSDDEPAAAGLLREHIDADFVALTLGPRGILLVDEVSAKPLPTVAREVFDVSGAGDTVIATMVAALSSGISVLDSVGLANLAAADVVSKAGTTAITTEALLVALQSHHHAVGLRKLFELEDLLAVIAAWRSRGQKVAFTNGCYDLIHAGHVILLEQASALADRLIVGINSDASVTRLKGPTRPLMPQSQRATVLSALECTDAVVVFEEDTPLQILEAIRPDVLIKGADYTKQTVVGADLVESYGGEVKLIPLVKGVSTSHLAAAIEKL